MMAVGAVASQLLVKYNRKGFMLDKELRQEREFQEQDLRIKQFTLYREDVRDLVNLTTSKMDLYLIISALLADKTFLMVCKSNEALPAPEWALELNVLSLGSGVLYLFLSMWLAIYASVAAHAYGTRMLVQFVRLPIASEKYLQNATAQSSDFEAASVADMLRIPFAQRKRPPAGEEAPQSSPSNRAAAALEEAPVTETASDPSVGSTQPQEDMLPTAMLEHVRLYRKVQLHWQAYDAYARVALFLGANCIIYSCLYWCLGQLIENQGAWIPELGTSLIFATLQLCLSRLDLRLRRGEAVAISIIVFMMPLCTTSGMVLYKHLEDMKEQHATHAEMKLVEMTMEFLAFIAHLLHAVVGCLVLLGAAWPDTARTEKFEYTVYLPGKFRAVLYLDVFGWLANTPSTARSNSEAGQPTASMINGPAAPPSPLVPRLSTVPEGSAGGGVSLSGATMESMRSPSFMEDRTPPVSRFGSVYSDVGSVGGSPPPLLSRLTSAPEAAMARIRTFRRESSGFDLRDEVQEEASNIFLGSQHQLRHSQSAPGASMLSGVGSMVSASSQPASASHSRPNATQVEAYGGDEAMQRSQIEQETNPTAMSTATFLPDPSAIPHISERRAIRTRLPGERPWQALRNATLVVVLLWCFSAAWVFSRFWAVLLTSEESSEQPVSVQEVSAKAGLALNELCRSHVGEAWLRQATSMRGSMAGQRFKDVGCGLQRTGNLDMSVACSHPSGTCTVAVLRRGGRSVSLCLLGSEVSTSGGGTLRLLRAWRVLRLAQGAVPLTQIALAAYANDTEAVRLYAHDEHGALLALRLLRVAHRRQSMLLAPHYDVAQAHQLEVGESVNGQKQTLLASADRVFSVTLDHKKKERPRTRRKKRKTLAPPSVCRPGRISSMAGDVEFGLTIKSWSMRDGSYRQAFLQGLIGLVPELLDGVCADHRQEQLGYRDIPGTALKGMYF